MKDPFRAKPKPFLDETRREWQFATFAWLLRHCGGFPKFLDTTLVLPIEEHFPASGMQGHAAAAALFRCVRDHAGMADWPCVVEPAPSGPRAAAPTDSLRTIHYDPAHTDPQMLVAGFALELARFLVESFEEPPPGGGALHEPAVELAATFMGFGVFMANASVSALKWQLNEGEQTHALALFCLLRKIDPETVEPFLNPHLRKHLRLAAGDLARCDAGFRRLRSVFAVIAVDPGDHTLPTQGGAARG